ncbi:AzlC family ABC transporter permease [Halomicrobium urmianum]|uniref:AzlC family ABC transporter permease n=1 Tax=Halomicrobium urmianum TaxID=1586233 RepID=UPI001CD95C7D|nr:AzlC family ABC transporter permease [Halomicrobium urmianum]
MDAADLRRGVRDVAPLLLGMIPFGFVVGIAAANAGLDLVQAVGMSAVVFAGASQLAALDLLASDAPLAVVVVTAGVVNLRMLMYSASIATYFRAFSMRWRAGLAFLLTDPAYALSIAAFRTDESIDRRAYYLGAAVTLWVIWQVTTVAGVVLGAEVPDALALDFTVPLVFLALTTSAVEDRPTAVAAVVGGPAATVSGGLPLDVGLLVGASLGVVAGVGTETLGGADAD